MSQPDPLSGLSFSDAPIPDHTASADNPPPVTPPPNPGADAQKKRTLPGKIFGSRDDAPRNERAKAVGSKPPVERKPLPPIPANMAEKIAGLYESAAMALMPIDMELAAALTEIAPKAGEAWVEIARQNRAVRIMLLKLIETSAWGALFAAHAPIFYLMRDRALGKASRTNMIGEFLAQSVHPDAEKPKE